MKLIRVIISSACLLLASIAAIPAQAGSSDFSGPFISLQASANGAELSGVYTDNDGAATEGTGGKVFPAAGASIGINIPLGPVFFIGVEGQMDFGQALISAADDAAKEANIDISARNRETWSITPGLSLSEGSAIFLRFGDTDIDLECTVGTTCPSSLSGDTLGIGSIAKIGHGLYIKAEAGYTEYGEISITNLGKGNNGSIDADPDMIYGNIQLGWQF